MDQEIPQRIKSLSVIQQVGMWLILKMPRAETDKFTFYSSDFAEKFKRFVSSKRRVNKTKYGRYIGGVLSGLLRKGLLVKISGDRDKLWTIADKIKENYDFYIKLLSEAKAYWPDKM